MSTASPSTGTAAPPRSPPESVILIVGRGPLADAVDQVLNADGRTTRRLGTPVDRDLRRALRPGVDAVVVIARDDAVALRAALLVEHVRPGVRLVVTVFDRTVAAQMRAAIPDCAVLSMADATAGALLGPCFADDLLAVTRSFGVPTGIERTDDGLRARSLEALPPRPLRRLLLLLRSQLRPHDRPSRLLVGSFAAITGLIATEALLVGLTHHEPAGSAVYAALKVATTVGPSPAIDHSPGWLQLYGSVSMALALGLAAVFTAALTSRLLRPRTTSIVGRRAVPRLDHVVVVGLGQVGFRVCRELQALGIAVVAVESDPQARLIRVAGRVGIPVVVADGRDRATLEALSLDRARALVAVSSDEVTNIAVSLTALAVAPGLRTVLRAGGNDVTRETQALFPVGAALDLPAIAGAALASTALGHGVAVAFAVDNQTFVQLDDGRISAATGDPRRRPPSPPSGSGTARS